MTASMGIDPSTTATGLALVREDGVCHPYLLKGNDKLKGMEKHKDMVTRIVQYVEHWQPDIIVIEGYSLNMRNPTSVVPLVELGGLIRFMFHLDGRTWHDPRAPQLKKFVTGSGVAQKDMMMKEVLKRWGFDAKSNDEADAYGLARMGLVKLGHHVGATKEMIKIANEMVPRTA